MPWPTPQDYQEAMQNPRIALADPELQAGRAEEDRLGLPRPITGGFASVYKVKGPAKTWAVRCFLKEFKDQQQRYDAISSHLSRANLSFAVEFNFLKQGIRVGGKWYPALKMEWIEGETLVRFVEKNLYSPHTLRSLSGAIEQMARALHGAGIAHGDFQHGNILVVNGKPKLIDYDGMYVPALRGWGSHEVGHPNYQHPAREEHDFGPGLDNFSVWVICLSLLALSVRPELWKQFRGGDDCLLFRRKDFEEPDRSAVFRELERLPGSDVPALVRRFRSSLLHCGPLQFPLINTHSHRRKPDWLDGYNDRGPPPRQVIPVSEAAQWEGKEVTVRLVVKSTYDGFDWAFMINSEEKFTHPKNFTVVVEKISAGAKYKEKGVSSLSQHFKKDTVLLVTGKVGQYKDRRSGRVRYQIWVKDPEQIQRQQALATAEPGAAPDRTPPGEEPARHKALATAEPGAAPDRRGM